MVLQMVASLCLTQWWSMCTEVSHEELSQKLCWFMYNTELTTGLVSISYGPPSLVCLALA